MLDARPTWPSSAGLVKRPEVGEVTGEERIGDAPVGATATLDDGGVAQFFQCATDGVPGLAAVWRLSTGDAACDSEAETVQAAQALDRLLVVDALAFERGAVALLASPKSISRVSSRIELRWVFWAISIVARG